MLRGILEAPNCGHHAGVTGRSVPTSLGLRERCNNKASAGSASPRIVIACKRTHRTDRVTPKLNDFLVRSERVRKINGFPAFGTRKTWSALAPADLISPAWIMRKTAFASLALLFPTNGKLAICSEASLGIPPSSKTLPTVASPGPFSDSKLPATQLTLCPKRRLGAHPD